MAALQRKLNLPSPNTELKTLITFYSQGGSEIPAENEIARMAEKTINMMPTGSFLKLESLSLVKLFLVLQLLNICFVFPKPFF